MLFCTSLVSSRYSSELHRGGDGRFHLSGKAMSDDGVSEIDGGRVIDRSKSSTPCSSLRNEFHSTMQQRQSVNSAHSTSNGYSVGGIRTHSDRGISLTLLKLTTVSPFINLTFIKLTIMSRHFSFV